MRDEDDIFSDETGPLDIKDNEPILIREALDDPFPEDVGDAASIERQEHLAKIEREREIEEFRNVLSTPGGRNVIFRILGATKLFHDPYGDTADILRMVGRQNVGRWLLTEIFTADDKAYILMQSEAKERNKKRS